MGRAVEKSNTLQGSYVDMTEETEFWSLCNQRREVKRILEQQESKLEEIDFQIWQQTRFMEHKSVRRWIKFNYIRLFGGLSDEIKADIYFVVVLGAPLFLIVLAAKAL